MEARFHRRKREKDVTLPFLQEDLVQVGFYIFYRIQVMNFHLSAKLLSQTLMWCLRWTNLLNDNPHWKHELLLFCKGLLTNLNVVSEIDCYLDLQSTLETISI